MFHDYYKILETEFKASTEEIKIAYKKQALKWHPDKNSGIDTLHQMQLINEAYLILKDLEGKMRYDIEYLKFKSFNQGFYDNTNKERSHESNISQEYIFSDEILKKWINNAKEQANKLATDTIASFKKGAKAAGKEMFERTIGITIVGFIFSLILLASKSCN